MVEKDRNLITTIIACRDHAKYVYQAGDTCLEQQKAPNELILINDGSLDDTDQRLLQLQKEATRLKIHTVVITHPFPYGHISSYNEGLRIASGKFIHLMAADDLLLNDTFYLNAMDLFRPSVGAVTCEVRHIDPDGKRLQVHSQVPYGGSWVPPREGLQLMLSHGNYVCGGGTVVRKEAYEPYDPELPYTADWLQWIHLLGKGYQIGVVRSSMDGIYGYRQHSESMSSKTHGTPEERNRCVQAIHEALGKLSIPQLRAL